VSEGDDLEAGEASGNVRLRDYADVAKFHNGKNATLEASALTLLPTGSSGARAITLQFDAGALNESTKQRDEWLAALSAAIQEAGKSSEAGKAPSTGLE